MRRGFRQSMAWLHAWSGLVVGWVMFAVIVTGTASYYRGEITRWMRPEIVAGAVDPARAADLAGAHLAGRMADAAGWYVKLPVAEQPLVEVQWWRSFEGPFHRALLDPETGAPTAARATEGGDFLYRFHFELGLPSLWGRWIVGACALVLLVALVSGIVTHRRIFADFFTFRRTRSPQRAWLDAHNVAGVLALPYHLMITYTGLVALAPVLMPWGAAAAYPGDPIAHFVASGMMPQGREPAGRPGPLASLGAIVREAAARGGETPEGLLVIAPGDAAATVTAVFEEPHGLAHRHPQLLFDGTSGAWLGGNGPTGAATMTGAVMVGLHEAQFAGPVLRVLFLLCGVMGAATVATGLLLWAVARAPKGVALEGAAPEGLGLRLVRALNVGVVAGLPAALAGYFLANRLLPLDLPARAAWETGAFFALWGLVLAIGAGRPGARAWREGLGLAALAFLAVPLADALTLGLQARFLGFDLAMLVLALALGLAAAKVGGPGRAARAFSAPSGALRA